MERVGGDFPFRPFLPERDIDLFHFAESII